MIYELYIVIAEFCFYFFPLAFFAIKENIFCKVLVKRRRILYLFIAEPHDAQAILAVSSRIHAHFLHDRNEISSLVDRINDTIYSKVCNAVWNCLVPGCCDQNMPAID